MVDQKQRRVVLRAMGLGVVGSDQGQWQSHWLHVQREFQ